MSERKTLGEQNYEQFADRYARLTPTKPHNAYYDRPAVLSLLPDDLTGMRILDAGCGPGHYAEALLQRGAEVVAFDVTPDFVRIATEHLSDYERVTVLQHDLHQPLDFAADATFDYVVCALVLDYIDNWHPVYAEFARVLKAGGKTVASHGHPMADYQWVQRLLGDNAPAYFETHEFTATWSGFGEPEPQVTSYRRPLQAMIVPILAAGLHIDTVLEPKPTDDYQAVAPENYDRLQTAPDFICFRAVKPAT